MKQYKIINIENRKVIATSGKLESIKRFLKIIGKSTDSVQIIDVFNHYEITI